MEAFAHVMIAGTTMGAIYALIAIGLNIQWGVSRILNIAYGEFLMFAGFGTFFGYTLFGINPLLSLVIFSPAFLGIGILTHRTMFERLLKTSESVIVFEVSAVLATYAVMSIASNSASILFGAELRSLHFLTQPIELLGSVYPTNRFVAFAVAIGMCILVFFLLNRTRIGKAIRATATDLDAARLMGIHVYNMLAISFGLGAMLAGAAGTLVSIMYPVSPFIGLNYLAIAMIVVVLGGMGNPLGSLVGGFVLGIVGAIVRFFEPGLSLAAFYIIFAAVLLVKPTGILSRKS